jgi:hypothetical protein
MRTYKVTAPVAGFSGEVGGVHFIRGEATVEAAAPLERLPYSDEPDQPSRAELAERDEIAQDPNYRALAYFRQAGYTVEDVTGDADPEPDGPSGISRPEDPPPPAANASTEEWRAWFVATGRLTETEAGKLSRNDLVAAYTKEGVR